MKLARAIAMLGTAALLLTGCGAGSGGETVDQAPSGLPVQGETIKYDPNKLVNDGKPIELEWWLWDGQEKFQAFADSYKKLHPNVTIKTVNQPWESYWTKLPLQLQSGKGPTLFNIHNSYDATLDPYLEPYDIETSDLEADYTGAAAHVVDGKVKYLDYGLMTGLIWYNKAMWADAGLTDSDTPKTWEQFREVAKKLTKHEGETFKQAGFNFNGTYQSLGFLQYQKGYNLFAQDAVTPTLDNPGTVQTMQYFLDLYNVDKVGSEDFGPKAIESFGQGQSAMVYEWGHLNGTLKKNYPSLDYGTFQTPVPDAAEAPYAFDRYNGESTPGINKGASEAEKSVAQDFMKFFLTDKTDMKNLVLNYSLAPAYKPLDSDVDIAANPVVKAMGSLDRYIWPGPMPATFETSITKAWQDVLYNGVVPETAISSAQKTIASDLAKTKFKSAEPAYAHYAPSPR